VSALEKIEAAVTDELKLSAIAQFQLELIQLTAKGEEPCSLAKDPGHPGDNWVTESGGLPAYICNVAKHIKADGHTTSQATASRGTASPSSFYGKTALRVEAADTTSVVGSTTAPYLYAVRARVAPRVNRTQTAIDDVVGVIVTNKSYNDYGTTFNGTEAVYIGNSGDPSKGKEWNAGIGIETVADKAMYISYGPYQYGILMTASFTSAAMRIPNNTPVVGRNAADSGDVTSWKVDTSNNVRLGAASTKVVVGAPNTDATPSQPFEVHANGAADGNLTRSHVRISDTTAFASGVGGAMGFAGYTDATPTLRTFGAIAGRKANATSGNAGGWLSLYSRNASTGLVEVLRLDDTQQLVITDASNISLGTTTGSKLGTSASQKLALWGATPVVQPTTAVAAATFVANTGTALNDASTFDGYTIKQVVKALRTIGALA
jgi:hypothetical protein